MKWWGYDKCRAMKRGRKVDEGFLLEGEEEEEEEERSYDI